MFAVSLSSSTFEELLAISFIQTAFQVGGQLLSVSIDTLNHSDSKTFRLFAIISSNS